MVGRLRSLDATSAVTLAALAAAVLVGLLSGVDPVLGAAAAIALLFLIVVVNDLMLGLCVMVLVSFLETISSLGSISLAKLVGGILAVSWLAAATTTRGRVRSFFAERPGLTYVLIVFLAWSAVSLAWSAVTGDAVSSVFRYTLNALLLPIAYTAVRNRRDATHVLVALVIGATLAAVSAIAAAPGADAGGRATGTVGDANELAAALVVGACVAAAFAVNRQIAPPWRLLALGAGGVCLLGILMSLSRGGLLGLGAAVLTAVLVSGRWRGRVIAGAVVVVALAVGYFAVFASLPAKERVTNVGGGTGRVDLWTVGWRMVEAHPVRGVGTGQFQSASVHYLLRPGAIQRGDFILSTPKVAHNTYLNVIAELGIIGGALFFGLIAFSVGCLYRAARTFAERGDPGMEILLRGLLAGVGGYLVTLLFISENYSKFFWVVLALGPALLAVARSGGGARRAPAIGAGA